MGPLRDLLVDPQGAIKVLLAHPDSAELRRTCEGYALDLGYVRQQIVERTRWLLREGNGRCEVRWYLSPPAFRIVATSAVMHFAPLVEGAGGSAAGSSVLEHGSPFYESAMRWFEGVWVSAVDAAHELEWAERDVLRNRAIFLDRDDTLIKDMAYASSHRDAPVVILPGVVEGLQRLSMAGYRLIVVSNQQAVGINAQTHEDLGLITQHIKAAFDEHGIHLDAFYYCTHAVTQQCNCRKPKPQLFLEAARRFCLDLAGSHFIGDADSDRDVAIHLPQMRVHVVDPPRGFAAVVEEILSSHPL
jgi:D-glycero-D-manno-heptose 1,7-bisphosphate phosphatase